MLLRVGLAIRWAPRGAQWKVEGVDRAALKDPACCNKFKEALRSIRPPPWSMSVDEHERFAASAVCRAAKTAFGSPAKRPRREHIDDTAWALICDRRIVKTWRRERRVSPASRGTAPGRTPDPLSVYMWASSKGDSAPLASRVFCELAASVAPLAEGHVVQCGPWGSLRVLLRHSGGVPKGYLKAASAVFLEVTACELDAAQADTAHDLAWCKLRSLTHRGGAQWKGSRALPGRIGEDGVSATTAQEISGVVLRHFAAIETAEVCSVESLADRHGRSRSTLAARAVRDIANVCDITTLRRLFARSKTWQGLRHGWCA